MLKIITLIFLVLVIFQYSISQSLVNPSPLPPRALDMKREVDSLSQNREKSIYNLIDDLGCECINTDSIRVLIQIYVNRTVALDSFDIVSSNVCNLDLEEEIYECVNNALNQRSLSLGELKFLPNSPNVQNIIYTFSIQ